MNRVAFAKLASTVVLNQAFPSVGSESADVACDSVNVRDPADVSVATVNPYRWFAGSYERSKKPTRSRPSPSYAAHGMNWSRGSAIAAGALHVWPPSHVWLTITSLFVTAEYGSAGTGAAAFRSSNQTTAKCRPVASVG